MQLGLIIDQFNKTEQDKDPGILAESLASLDAQVSIYCLGSDVSETKNYRLRRLEPCQRDSVKFWAQEKTEVFLIYSWLSLRYSRLIKALKKNNKKIILKLDSDGRLLFPFKPSYLRVRGLNKSLKSLLVHGLRLLQWSLFPKLLSRLKINQLLLADAVLIESPEAHENLRRSLAFWGQEKLMKKIFFLPNPVLAPDLLTATHRENTIISVGRWHDQRKNAAGLKQVFKNFPIPGWQLLLVGHGATRLQDYLRRRNPSLKIAALENVAHQDIFSHLGSAKIFFAPSIAESYNLAAAEALASGLSLAATPLESFYYFSARGRWGSLASDFSPASLRRALEMEIGRWQNNFYDPEEIKNYWRHELAPKNIALGLEKIIQNLEPEKKQTTNK